MLLYCILTWLLAVGVLSYFIKTEIEKVEFKWIHLWAYIFLLIIAPLGIPFLIGWCIAVQAYKDEEEK